MFVQRLNMLTGEAEWVVSDATGDGDPEDDSSDFVASSSYLDMLADTYRNAAYRIALEKTARPGDHVLDIGTGTGLLAMMAARIVAPGSVDGGGGGSMALGNPAPGGGRVTACEVFPPMAALAKRVIRANGMQHVVEVVGKRSSDTSVAQGVPGDGDAQGAADMAGRADVLVTEIFDSELLGEGLLPTLRDAVPRLLRDGAAVVPARARCFFQLVECGFLASCSPYCGGGPSQQGGAAADLQTMRELHVAPLAEAPQGRRLAPLAAPVELLSFELARPPLEDRTESRQVAIAHAGRADAVVFWWQLEMDAEAEVLISTAPPWITETAQGADRGPLLTAGTEGLRQGWRDHWKACWCAVGASSFRVSAGDSVVITARQSEINVTAGAVPLSPGALKPLSPPVGNQWLCVTSDELKASSPNRVYTLKDEAVWANKFGPALQRAVLQQQQLPSHSTSAGGVRCIVLGDSTPLAELLARMDAVEAVVALQDDAGSRRLLLSQAEQRGHGPRVSAQGLRPFLLRASHAAAAAAAAAAAENRGGSNGASQQQGKFHVVAAEPFYRSCEGLLPWASLRFWHEVDLMRESGAIHPTAALIPCKASVWGVCVSLPELWRTRAPLSAVEGLDLSLANPLLGSSSSGSASEHPQQGRRLPIMACAAWQCGPGLRELSERVKVLEFDFSGRPHTTEAVCTAPVICDGECHALLLYVDYDLTGTADVVMSGAPDGSLPSAATQGLQVLPEALELKAGRGADSDAPAPAVAIRVKWDADDGSLCVDLEAPAN